MDQIKKKSTKYQRGVYWKYKYYSEELNEETYVTIMMQQYQTDGVKAFWGQYSINNQNKTCFLHCIAGFGKRVSPKIVKLKLKLGDVKVKAIKKSLLKDEIKNCLDVRIRVAGTQYIGSDSLRRDKQKEKIQKEREKEQNKIHQIINQQIQTEEIQESNQQFQILSQLLDSNLRIEQRGVKIEQQLEIIRKFLESMQQEKIEPYKSLIFLD
ncbi:unnamed protein product [Paramecium sonneborni]|uniref:Uncharacterized protein n=1 Tax=Paramecium sonneborni TaxID=65129 RepID=A0A8S1RNS1_9CILI|nr:unnamed protein product [Paramecium sonneborni]